MVTIASASACATDAFGDELPRVTVAHRRMAGDDLVNLRLRERRFVPFVVAVAAVPDEIDQGVEPEAVTIGPRQPRRLDARDRIVRIDVDDWNLEAARQAARVAGAVRLLGLGGESQLVVRDDVNRCRRRRNRRAATNSMSRPRRPVRGTPNRRESGSPSTCSGVQHRLARAVRPSVAAARAMPAQHRIDRLEVARVRRHADDERLAAGHRPRLRTARPA